MFKVVRRFSAAKDRQTIRTLVPEGAVGFKREGRNPGTDGTPHFFVAVSINIGNVPFGRCEEIDFRSSTNFDSRKLTV